MLITKEIIEKVAADTGITMDKLPVSGLLALLQDKRRKIMIDKFRYTCSIRCCFY